MNKLQKYLSPIAIEELRIAIDEANGNEVFFIGRVNAKKIIESVRVIARGNRTMVPVLRQQANSGEVIIHNHPSGDLHPSTNDLAIAQELSEFGISSYIVNNEVDDIYVLFEPLTERDSMFLDPLKICSLLKPKGSVANKLIGYEYRPQQMDMIACICTAFNENKLVVVEAGTGVGKTMAYLLPAIYWAVKNKERCVVSTNTINLQEQLIKKDIPLLQSALNFEFQAVLIKGRHNYVCLRKMSELMHEPELLLDPTEQDEIKTLINWAKQSKDGSKSDLNFIPKEQIWEKIAAESDTCARRKCPFYKQCFVNLARREATKAHILVVNHHLFFSDLAVRSSGIEVAVLPPYNRVIFDEAQHIEDVATSYLGTGITRIGIQRILGRLYRKHGAAARGYLPFLTHKIQELKFKIQETKLDEVQQLIEQKLINQIAALETITNEAMDAIFNVTYTTTAGEFDDIKRRITSAFKEHPLWETTVSEKTSDLIFQMKRLCSDLSAMISLLESCNISFSKEMETLFIDIHAQRNRLSDARNVLEKVLFEETDSEIRWIEVKPRALSNIVRLKIVPLDVARTMYDEVYRQFRTIVMTSATLAVAGIKDWDEFDYLAQRIGLNYVDKKRKLTVKLSTPFDYQTQAIIGIPLDIPAPDESRFSDTLTELILQSVTTSQGRAFILFTSYGLLNLIHSRLEGTLSQMGFTTLKQGTMNRHQLLELFKKDTTSVLFATDSFWEGVDVPGKALESVIITKLPFKVPSEPIVEARIEAIQKRGGNAFMEYSVPQAVIKLKQGLGRLIRSKSDRGSVLIFDKRIIEKSYGAVFIASLPNTTIVKGSRQIVFAAIEKFFENTH